jgi:hypothetical protein
MLEKKLEYSGTVHQLFIDLKKAYDPVVLEFSIPKKLVKLIKICLNETYSKICVGKHLSDTFPIHNHLKQGDALLPLLFSFALEMPSDKSKKIESIWN